MGDCAFPGGAARIQPWPGAASWGAEYVILVAQGGGEGACRIPTAFLPLHAPPGRSTCSGNCSRAERAHEACAAGRGVWGHKHILRGVPDGSSAAGGAICSGWDCAGKRSEGVRVTRTPSAPGTLAASVPGAPMRARGGGARPPSDAPHCSCPRPWGGTEGPCLAALSATEGVDCLGCETRSRPPLSRASRNTQRSPQDDKKRSGLDVCRVARDYARTHNPPTWFRGLDSCKGKDQLCRMGDHVAPGTGPLATVYSHWCARWAGLAYPNEGGIRTSQYNTCCRSCQLAKRYPAVSLKRTATTGDAQGGHRHPLGPDQGLEFRV